MNYGDVNGFDFWNNSAARSVENKHLYGTIFHKEVRNMHALNQEVSFKDNKEGMFGVRVARALELPSDKPAVYLDAHGVLTTIRCWIIPG